jgi:hypothetical protein
MTDFNWWIELTHGGIFISNPVLHESFDEKFVESWHWRYKRLRDHYNTYCSKLESYRTGTHPVNSWITNIFEDFLGHESKHWLKGNSIPINLSTITSTGLTIKPTRVLVDENDAPLLLLKRDEAPRLGMHKGRRSYSQFVNLLRKTHTQLGILTNGMQIRLVYAGLDHDAWVQWQVDAWFDEGETRHQLDGLLTLLHPDNFRVEEESFKLLDAVITSRNRQADLADVLGGQIRRAVELLTAAIGRNQQQNAGFLDPIQITPGTESILSETDTLNAVYQSATRLVMRKVVLFYAEAKELLPNSDPFYHNNYSLEGLYAQLLAAVQHTGDEELKTHYSAWQRFLALSKMVHQGSEHEVLPLKAYGGTLFRPGASSSSDPVLRALSLFERPNLGISDFEVYQILRLIKIGKTKVRQGRRSTYVSGPVDFGDLRTEYIGMMYEGLLDYELKRVGASDPRVILNIGDQPILSLSLIEPMDESAIKNLFKKMKVESDGGGSESTESDEFETVEVSSDNPETIYDSTTYGRALQWGVRAVEIGRLISRPRGAAAQEVYREKILAKARSLIVQVLEPGEMYLARWGGTRKGSGTFYTKPSLAVPTTQRTLAPLVYDIDGEEDGVKEPKTILDLKICDPSVGSGTFLVAAARYLTEALYESVLAHTLKKRDEAGNVVVRPKDNIILSKDLRFEAPPIKSTEDGWEDQMKARLKRLVVEHCLFGVDLNGMAVELARLALWLETMDKDLPFEFLDHRIKQGNSLVGTWFSQYLNYPVKAWERQDGTGSTKRNREILKDTIKPELLSFITGSLQYNLLEKVESPEITLDRQLKYWTELENTQLFDTEKREEIYLKKIEEDVDYLRLKHQFDRWCAVWFWPSENEKYPILSPKNIFIEDDKISDVVKDIQSRNNFFHWELEFPEVFTKYSGHLETGFDSILGNPPWNIQKANSMEFFSNYDPIYRTYGKQEAIRKQTAMFAESEIVEQEWHAYNGYFKAMSNYVRSASDPYNIALVRGRANDGLKQQWKRERDKQGYKHCRKNPYKIQGGADLDLYKLFLEQSFHLMKPEGRLGMILPSGIYTDKGGTDIRKTFLEKAKWEWLFIFENTEKIFDIHKSKKFGPIILSKEGTTDSIKCAFMRHDVKDWESPDPPHMEIPVEKIKRFSPNTLSFMEFKSPMDLQICEKIYGDRPLLGDQVEGGWNVKFATEFHMTNDSHLFPPITKWIENGYEPDGLGRWINSNGDVALPLYEGRMIGQFDFSENGWVSGKGRSAVWREIPFDNKQIKPQYLMGKEDYKKSGYLNSFKVGVMKISSSTNSRSLIAGPIFNNPVGNSINAIRLPNMHLGDYYYLLASFNSFVFDSIIRLKMGGINLSDFILNELPIPPAPGKLRNKIIMLSAELSLIDKSLFWHLKNINDYLKASLSPRINTLSRLQARVELDVLFFELYSLNVEEVNHLLSPSTERPTGFWRIDKSLPLEQRQTTLTLEAFKHLNQVGLERFLEEGWELPDYVTEFDRPGIKIWEPEGGWEKAWAEARALLTEEDWKEFTGETVSGAGNSGSGQEEEPPQQGLF